MAAADNILQNDINNDFFEAQNWSAHVPEAGDRLFINGDHVITANVDFATHGCASAIFHVGPNFTGQMGTAANPVEMGNASQSTLNYNAPLCENFHLDADILLAQIVNTHHTLGCITLQADAADIDELRVYGGTGLKVVDGAFTCAKVVVDGPGALVTIENLTEACTLLEVNSGRANITGAATTISVGDGTVALLGSSKTYAAVNCYGDGGRVLFEGTTSIITNCKIKRGWAIATKNVKTVTFTNTIEIESAGHFRAGAHCIWSGTPDANAWGNADVKGIPDVTLKTFGVGGAQGA